MPEPKLSCACPDYATHQAFLDGIVQRAEPHTWALPDEPGPEVTRVRDRDENAPLTDATPADGGGCE